MKKFWIYTIGVALLGLFYFQFKAAFGGPVFLAGSILYLLVVRMLAERLGK